MEIQLTTQKIYDYALALTAHIGRIADAYAGVAITEDNYPLLDVYMSSGVHIAETRIRKYLDNSHEFDLKCEEGSVVLTLKDGEGIDSRLVPMITTGLRLFLAYYVAAQWLLTTAAKDYFEPYLTQANVHLDSMAGSLNYKGDFKLGDEAYSLRSEDHVLVRPVAGEPDNLLTVRSDEGPDYAVTKAHEYLKTSNYEQY